MIIKKEKYDIAIANYDEINSTRIILNGDKDNAQSLFYRLMSGAQQTINIISNKLEHYNEKSIIEALKLALTRKVKVNILLDGNINDIKNNDFFDYCMSNENCTIRHSESVFKNHIITRDSKAYRYCVDTNNHSAIASFNGPEIAKNADSKIFANNIFKKYELVK